MITKQMTINFLIDTKGYNEEEAKRYIIVCGTSEIKEDLLKYYNLDQVQDLKKEIKRCENLDDKIGLGSYINGLYDQLEKLK